MGSVISTLERKTLVEYIDSLVAHSDGTYRCACELHGGGYDETRFDVYCDSVDEAMRNGRQYVEVEVIE